MPVLDANVILRYLLRDVPDMAEQAREVILEGASTTTEVLAEVVYVLAGVYHANRGMIADALESLLSEVQVPNRLSLQYAIRLYRATGLDFVDCVLAGYHHAENQEVMTFDKKLKKALQTDMIASEKG